MAETSVPAIIRYLAPGTDKPVYRASSAGVDDSHDKGVTLESREVRIHDARRAEPAPTLDAHGFTLVEHRTGVADFYGLDDMRDFYEREIIGLLLKATGGSDALVFDHTLRSDSPAVRGNRSTREPADFIHNDYTDRSARRRLRDLLPAEEAERRLSRRFAIVNVWRSVNGTVYNSPMTCCDAATIAPEDRVPVERRAKDRIGEVEFITWNPNHRWYYYPQMTMAEALLIKTFDSATDGRATRSIHTAFSDPLAPADAPPRESIESRAFVFFDD